MKRVTPSARTIQAAWRGTAPKRYRLAAIAAAILIQSTFRMFRITRLHQRLLQVGPCDEGGPHATSRTARPPTHHPLSLLTHTDLVCARRLPN